MTMRLAGAVLILLLAAACAAPARPGPAAEKRIALSFDDVPRERGAFMLPQERTARLIRGLHRAGVRQAAFFVTPGNLERPDGAGGERRIAAYVRAGHVIANHSWAHTRLSETDAAAYLADIDRAAAWLAGRAGYRPWFRYPFLDEGGGHVARRDAIRAGLVQRGLANGYVTVDSSDWNMEQRAIDARAAGRAIDRAALRDLYVESHVEAAEFYDGLARRVLGRSPAHMLLLHETDMAALFVTDLVAGLRAAGWTIVSADEAYADAIAARAGRVVTPSAQGTLTEMIAWEAGLLPPRWYERNEMPVANRLFDRRVLHVR